MDSFADICVGTRIACRGDVVRSADGVTGLHPLLARRHSPRSLGGARVADEVVVRLLEAARWAPSSGNGQPWAFVVVHRDDPEHAAVAGLLSGRNALWAPAAPLVVAAFARTTDAEGRPRPASLYDLGLAVAQLIAQAGADGYAARQMGGFDKPRAREVFAAPAGWEPVVLIAIGRAGDPASIADELRAGEHAPRTRRPLADIAFRGRFGVPLDTPASAT